MEYYVANVHIVVQAENKHDAAKAVGSVLNPLQKDKTILDWGPQEFVDGKEMNYIGVIDEKTYQEGDFYKKIQ